MKKLEDWEFIALCEAGTAEEIRNAIHLQGANVDASDIEGYTALMSAALGNNLEAVKVLVQEGAYLNFQHERGYTALTAAIYSNNLEMVNVLIKAGADVNYENDYGISELMEAVCYGNPDIVNALIKAGARVYAVNTETDETIFDYAESLPDSDDKTKIIAMLKKADAF